MRSSSFVGALGGIVLLGTAALPNSAMAFGQQWRPAQGYAPNPVSRYQRVANIPSFRPSMGANPQRQHRDPRDSFVNRTAHRASAWQRPARRHQLAERAYYRRPLHPQYAPTPHTAPMAGWGGPLAAMAQVWPQPMPFPQQGSWHPAQRPWQASHYALPQRPYMPQYQARMSYPMQPWAPAPQRHSAVAPSYRGWRPVAQAAVSRLPVATPQPVHPVPVWTMDPLANTAVLARGHANGAPWRPVGTGAAPGVRADVGFRPAAYGRGQQVERRLASENKPSAGRRGDLPGWATTYTNDVTGYACTWCNGS
jgi:hypothetical protein